MHIFYTSQKQNLSVFITAIIYEKKNAIKDKRFFKTKKTYFKINLINPHVIKNLPKYISSQNYL